MSGDECSGTAPMQHRRNAHSPGGHIPNRLVDHPLGPRWTDRVTRASQPVSCVLNQPLRSTTRSVGTMLKKHTVPVADTGTRTAFETVWPAA